MAITTDLSLRNQMIYCIYVRNYGKIGNFAEVEKDLQRIKDLGTDIIWFLPIHPTGYVGRKGSLGCPYAIKDYRDVNPEYGTMEDFKKLVDAIHDHGMKCMIDVVYNHTSPDSVLVKEHPDWFIQDENGRPTTLVPEWSDIVELDFSKMELWDYLIDTLKMWAGLVDGFRCDVAPKVPLELWLRARDEVAQVRKDCIWLAESGEPGFINLLRKQGMYALSDSELYQAFDICYDYDLQDVIRGLQHHTGTLEEYTKRLQLQESIYPNNYVKMRYLENHDRARAAFLYPDLRVRRNMTAFSFFQKGIVQVYNGQERSDVHRPSLFDKDDIDWTGEDLSGLISQLMRLKREDIYKDGFFEVKSIDEEYIYASYEHGKEGRLGVFSINGKAGCVPTSLEDGTYINDIDRSKVEVYEGLLSFQGEPVIIKYEK